MRFLKNKINDKLTNSNWDLTVVLAGYEKKIKEIKTFLGAGGGGEGSPCN